MDKKKSIPVAGGRPHTESKNSMTVGNRRPVFLQDYFLNDDMLHFNGRGDS